MQFKAISEKSFIINYLFQIWIVFIVYNKFQIQNKMENKFKTKLKHGNKFEQLFAKEYLQPNNLLIDCFNDDKRYDIMTTAATKQGELYPVSWEIKTDNYAHHSCNFYLEFESYGNPSGIKETEADYFVVLIPSSNVGYIFYRTTLIQHLEDSYYQIKNGGDDKMTKAWVMPIELLLQNTEYTKINITMEHLIVTGMNRCEHNQSAPKTFKNDEIEHLEKLLQQGIIEAEEYREDDDELCW